MLCLDGLGRLASLPMLGEEAAHPGPAAVLERACGLLAPRLALYGTTIVPQACAIVQGGAERRTEQGRNTMRQSRRSAPHRASSLRPGGGQQVRQVEGRGRTDIRFEDGLH